MADLGNHQQTYGHGTAYYPGKATAEEIAAAKETTFDVTTTEEATTTEEPTTEHTVHHFVTDYTNYNKDGEAGKIDETPAETTEEEMTVQVASAHDVYDLRYFCTYCYKNGIYEPFTVEELDAHIEENASGKCIGACFGIHVVVGSTTDKYEKRMVEVLLADAYDTYYLHYTCFDCGETMVGKVVHTYNGKKPEGYDGEISYASEKSETITFDKAGKTGGTSWNSEKLRYDFKDTTYYIYGVDVLEAGVEYDH